MDFMMISLGMNLMRNRFGYLYAFSFALCKQNSALTSLPTKTELHSFVFFQFIWPNFFSLYTNRSYVLFFIITNRSYPVKICTKCIITFSFSIHTVSAWILVPCWYKFISILHSIETDVALRFILKNKIMNDTSMQPLYRNMSITQEFCQKSEFTWELCIWIHHFYRQRKILIRTMFFSADFR